MKITALSTRLILVLSGVLGAVCASAQTAYVNDQLEITLRSGESTQHSIERMLTSGTRLEVLSRNADNGYTQVQLQNGDTGYVLTRFLSDIPAARDRLVRVEQQLATLKAAKARVDEQLQALRSAKNDTDKTSSDVAAQNAQLTQEIDEIRRTAADALSIDARNKSLNTRLTASEQTIDELRLDNAQLKARSAQWWFVLGGGAVLLGAVLGFTLPRMRWRRKSRWGEL